ncbi:MAG: SurA N-terminal domain-containing protein [Kiritimatiellaeota bacterium]|nr:SurA N-terminal domain-containing protein [Kiritimatiellota bacterium]
MKKSLILLLFAASTLFAQTNSEPVITAIDGYAARVNNRIITYGDIRESIAPVIQQLLQRYQGEELVQQLQQLHIQGRETLIEEALIQEEAKSQELALPPKVIDDEVESIIRDRFDGDRALFNRALAERRMTLEEWREEITDRLVMQVYYSQEVLRKVRIPDEAVRAEYDRVREKELAIPFRVKYRFILINKGATKEEQAVKRKQVEDILQKLRDGADFAALAEKVSEGDTSLSPWRDPADVKEILRPALQNTPAGGISELIEDNNVFYIVNVESRQEEGTVPFEEVRDPIKQNLAAQERERLHDKLIERLTARHYIERY